MKSLRFMPANMARSSVLGALLMKSGGGPVPGALVMLATGTVIGLFNGLAATRDPRGWYAQGVFQFTPRWSVGHLHHVEDATARC